MTPTSILMKERMILALTTHDNKSPRNRIMINKHPMCRKTPINPTKLLILYQSRDCTVMEQAVDKISRSRAMKILVLLVMTKTEGKEET